MLPFSSSSLEHDNTWKHENTETLLLSFTEALHQIRRWGASQPEEEEKTALVLSGGGARAAYQAGVLRYVAEAFPQAHFPILTGVSAGAINAAHLANHAGSFEAAVGRLIRNWEAVTTEQVFEVESGLHLLWRILRGRWRNGGDPPGDTIEEPEDVRALLDTSPLRVFLQKHLHTPNGQLTGVEANLQRGRLDAFGVLTTNYATGQTVIFVQGSDDVQLWERPNRVSVQTALTVDHVMASTALPLIFPAVKIGEGWYGDGGIRLAAPLAPAIHLGADRMLVISTRYPRSRAEADEPAVIGYPPAAQIAGVLLNATFVDALEQDARTLRRVNRLVRALPRRRRGNLRPIRLLEVRPSVDLVRLSREYEATLPAPLQILAHALGTDRTQSPDWLSMLLFEKDYVTRLLEIGYEDARRQHDALIAFLEA